MKTPLTSQCALCDGTGWRPVQKSDDKGEFRAVEQCSCQNTPRDLDWWMDRAQIPPRFRDSTFEGFFVPSDNSSLQMALVKARGFASQYPLVDKGLLLLGNPGVGKTHLTVAILKRLMVEKSADCLFCSYPDLLQQLLESYDPISRRSSAEILQPVLDVDVLALDDLGARRVSDWVEDTVTYIMSYRYNQKKLTLLTTNLLESEEQVKQKREEAKQKGDSKISFPDTLTDRIGLRTYSRLLEMCERVFMSADDLRQTVKANERGRRAR